MTRQEVFSIYKTGWRSCFAGNGLNFAPELNYALFYSKVRLRSPVLLTLTCRAGRGESHAEVIQNGPPDAADRGRNRDATENSPVCSTTWMKGIQPESGKHAFGLFMNDLLLDYYGIDARVELVGSERSDVALLPESVLDHLNPAPYAMICPMRMCAAESMRRAADRSPDQ